MKEFDGEDVVDIKGKKFVKFSGLLKKAHETNEFKGVKINRLEVNIKEKTAYCVATVIIGENSYMAAGSSNPQNTGSLVMSNYVEMAQTRAVARAFRYAMGVVENAYEEIDQKED